MIDEKNLKTPAAASGSEPAVPTDHEPFEVMATAHLIAAAPGRYLENSRFKNTIKGATLDLYHRLAPRDAQESILSLLAVTVANSSLDCLALAAHVPPDNVAVRELNVGLGLKAATTAAELLKALDERRREKPDRLTVGAVNVNSGGQAIVGNVRSAREPASNKDKKE